MAITARDGALPLAWHQSRTIAGRVPGWRQLLLAVWMFCMMLLMMQ